jgi:hypothetical protein
MARRRLPRKVTYFEPVLPRLARNTIIESTFEVGRRFRCTMRVDCGQLDPGAVIRPVPEEWHPRVPQRLDEEELADWRAGHQGANRGANSRPGHVQSGTRPSKRRGWAWEHRADRRGGRPLGRLPSALRCQRPAPARSPPAASCDCRAGSGGKVIEPSIKRAVQDEEPRKRGAGKGSHGIQSCRSETDRARLSPLSMC